METWRRAWREGVVPQTSTRGLIALANGLADNDKRLMQGISIRVRGSSIKSACALAYIGWQGEGLESVAEVMGFFWNIYFSIDLRLDRTVRCRHFLEWFDETPRKEMRYEMIKEVELALFDRELQEHVVTSLGIDVRLAE